MKKKYIASTLLGLGIGHMTLLFSQTDANEESSHSACCESGIIIGEPLNPCVINAGYPYPATILPSCGWDIYAKGEFLYMAATLEHNTPFGNAALDGSELTWDVLSIPYRPAFRVSLGADLGSVLLDLSYLRYHAHHAKNFNAGNNAGITASSAPPDALSELLLDFKAFFQNVRANLQLDLDLAAISLQKPVYMGKRILMNLNYGLLGLWSAQKWNLNYVPLAAPLPPGGVTSDGRSVATAKSWAVGPQLGFSTTALFPMHFKAIAGIKLALQYGYVYKFQQIVSFPEIPRPFISASSANGKKASGLQALHTGELGIGWGDYFYCDRFYIDLSLTYNFLFQHIYSYGFAFNPTFFQGLDLDSYTVHGIAIGGQLNF